MRIDFNKNGKVCGHMEVKNSAGNTNPQLYIYGDICGSEWDKWCSDDKCPQDVANLLNSIDQNSDIDIYINSGGGDVFGALAIISQLNRHNGKKTAHVDGLAASAASVIAVACDEIVMSSSAQLMIHKPLFARVTNCNADMLREYADVLEKAEESITDIYMNNVKDGVTREDISAKMAAETWLKGNEAAELFNNISVIETGQAVACCSDYFGTYKHAPKGLISPEESEKIEAERRKKALQIQLDLSKI